MVRLRLDPLSVGERITSDPAENRGRLFVSMLEAESGRFTPQALGRNFPKDRLEVSPKLEEVNPCPARSVSPWNWLFLYV